MNIKMPFLKFAGVFFFSLLFSLAVSAENMQVTFGATNFAPLSKKEEIIAHYASLQAPLFEGLGATSFESYVRWSGAEIKENEWDFSMYDVEVEYLRSQKLKWVPFIIAGPAYTTPDWFKQSSESLFYKCLEHGQESEVQSLWNPHLKKHIEAFIKKFSQHYEKQGVIESVLVGITGDFGEAIYPVSGGGWTGNYHQHQGLWSGDKEAVKNFQTFLKKKYNGIKKLNAAWNTGFTDFTNIKPFTSETAPSPAAFLDEIQWYRNSMSLWVDFWLKTTKKYFPRTPVYLCTGGDGYPDQGSDFSAQVKIAAKNQCGVRITNEASSYPFNFILTRWVSSAGKFYNSFFGFEPASGISREGLVNRIYNATASGAVQLFEYTDNLVKTDERKNTFKDNAKFLIKRAPDVKAAAFIPTTYLTVRHAQRWGKFFMDLAGLRPVTDFDFADENMIEDGALKNYQILFIVDGSLVKKSVKEKILAFVQKGGILFGYRLSKIKTLEGDFLLPGSVMETLKEEKESTLADAARFGEGYILSTLKKAPLKAYRETLSEIIYHTDKLDKKYKPLPFANDQDNGIYTTYFKDGILILNTSPKTWESGKFSLEPYSIKFFAE